MARPGPPMAPLTRTSIALVALLLAAAGPAVLLPLPAAAQDEQGPTVTDSLVPQSLWGVRQAVGLGVTGEFLTNHGDRAFWQDRPDGTGVRVAVIDTGADLSHPDLEGSLACDRCWRDLVNGRSAPYDDNGHGTHVAGIIAGSGHLQINPLKSYFPTGARGLAPGAQLIVAKAMNATGGGSDETVAEAILWALDPDGNPSTRDGAHIVHLSLGVETPSGALPSLAVGGSKTEQAVRDAIARGVFVVMSAGNQGREGPAPPGNVPGVVAVGALDTRGNILAFSNRGVGVDLYAPGVIMSTWPAALDDDGIGDGYTGFAGTSQAAPVVTGAIALALQANPALRGAGGATKVAHLEDALVATATPLENGGSGVRLDAAALLADQDAGATGVAWSVVVVLALATLAVLVLVLRVVFRLLRRHAEDHEAAEAERADPGNGHRRRKDERESNGRVPANGPPADERPGSGPHSGGKRRPDGAGDEGSAPDAGEGPSGPSDRVRGPSQRFKVESRSDGDDR